MGRDESVHLQCRWEGSILCMRGRGDGVCEMRRATNDSLLGI